MKNLDYSWISTGITLLFCIGIFGLLIGFPIKWMWNYLMPEIFGLKQITFWQGFWLFVFCQCLFTSNPKSTPNDEK